MIEKIKDSNKEDSRCITRKEWLKLSSHHSCMHCNNKAILGMYKGENNVYLLCDKCIIKIRCGDLSEKDI